MKGRHAEFETELGYARHRLPMGAFSDPKDPPAVLELEADGVIEHFEREEPPRKPEGPGLPPVRSRSVLFICREPPKYAVHSLHAPQAKGERWTAWIDRYVAWSEVVEGHPEFAHRDVHGRRPSAKTKGTSVEVHTRPRAAADASASFF